jgi:hypothetical protein
MALDMAPVDRSLWRIAELSSRCSDPSWPGDKDGAWLALKEAIADVKALVRETTAAIEAAELRAARAEGRIRVVRRERDRERAAHQASRAAAEVAQERAKAAHEAAKASRARAEQAQAALDAALGAREAAEMALRWALERSEDATAARARAELERDEVRAAYLALRQARAAAEADQARAQSAVEAAQAAGAELERTAVVNGDAPPEVSGDAPQPGAELAFPGGDGVVDITTDAEGVFASDERYLHVGATMGHLLPEDLEELLVDGATIVRREGRLAALISVPSEESEWAAPSRLAEEQTQRLADAGFRVQWVREICLAS